MRSSVSPLRRVIILMTVVALAATIGGCSGIPDSGPVTAGDPVNADQSIDLDIIARSPQPGWTQEQILAGFIDAAASPRNDYQIARQFLTPAYAREWVAGAGVAIDLGADERSVISSGTDSMSVTIRQTGTVSANGEYRPAVPTTQTLEYAFEQVDGEWRLSSTPPGVLVDQPTFSQVFNRHVLYFFDPTFSFLVPDLRWFAVRRESTQTSIVRELLRGPAEWLAAGVVSAFPEGASLVSDTVPVASRQASVDLTGEALPDDLVSLQRMKLQLTESLASVRNIQSVALSIDGRDEDVPDLSGDAVIVHPRVDPRSIVYRDGVFGALSFTTQDITRLDGISPTVEALVPTGVALGVDSSAAAVLAADGVHFVRRGAASASLDPRPGLITPAIDNLNIVWTVPRDQPGALRWFAPDGSTGEVGAPWAEAGAIVSLDVSRDGTRLFALLDRDGRATVSVVSIAREPELGLPQALGEPLEFPQLDGAPIDGAWLDEFTVGALVTGSDGATVLVVQQLGGTLSRRVGPVDGRSLAGSNTVREPRVLTGAGQIVTETGVTWQPQAEGIGLIASQQAVGVSD